MAKRSKPPALDEAKKSELLALLSAGCSRRVAAAYVGCPECMIRHAARHDAWFAEALKQAESQAEIFYLQNIRRAAAQERHWRAAAWALERRSPQDFAPRPPDTMRVEEVVELMRECASVVMEEVTVAEYRKKILKRVATVLKSLGLPPDEIWTGQYGPPAAEKPGRG